MQVHLCLISAVNCHLKILIVYTSIMYCFLVHYYIVLLSPIVKLFAMKHLKWMKHIAGGICNKVVVELVDRFQPIRGNLIILLLQHMLKWLFSPQKTVLRVDFDAICYGNCINNNKTCGPTPGYHMCYIYNRIEIATTASRKFQLTASSQQKRLHYFANNTSSCSS